MLIFVTGILGVVAYKLDVVAPRPTLKMHEFGGLATQASKKTPPKKFSPLS
ncbi:MAG: hypothetical protein HQL17_08605, partial [Candidatus Omnitrophica bacterium]|nr:hypothetical protein [Candidatus Omnitrophota bacterium]